MRSHPRSRLASSRIVASAERGSASERRARLGRRHAGLAVGKGSAKHRMTRFQATRIESSTGERCRHYREKTYGEKER